MFNQNFISPIKNISRELISLGNYVSLEFFLCSQCKFKGNLNFIIKEKRKKSSMKFLFATELNEFALVMVTAVFSIPFRIYWERNFSYYL